LTKRILIIMNSSSTFIQKLNPLYFWDINLSGLDESKSYRLIIERVFSLGEVDEINLVIRFYGEKKVLEVLSDLSYLDPKTLNFISKFFNKPIKEFRCHVRKQSKPQHWI
jgi:hypothetical protein